MSEVPLSPVGREQIHKLESALLIGSILRPDVIEELRNPEERLTWVDSLAVAAALAREKAKLSVSQIADEIGRSEATIRNHLQGKTKAGQIVRETYEKFAREGVNITLPDVFPAPTKSLDTAALEEEVNRLKKAAGRREAEK
ncbi:MAG: hypothetical protein NXY59_06495 [Aigarchaeota archaeon]|nr:hypothetical protein [Candidatus Pelearchaeum maunauluense]